MPGGGWWAIRNWRWDGDGEIQRFEMERRIETSSASQLREVESPRHFLAGPMTPSLPVRKSFNWKDHSIFLRYCPWLDIRFNAAGPDFLTVEKGANNSATMWS